MVLFRKYDSPVLLGILGGSGWRGTQLRGCPPSFWGQSPNSPSLRLAQRVRRKAPQRNWCLTPITRCAERPISLILQAGVACEQRKPPTLAAEGDAVGAVAKHKDLWDRSLALSPTRNGMLEVRRPKAGGHSRSYPVRHPRLPGAWDSVLDLRKQSA